MGIKTRNPVETLNGGDNMAKKEVKVDIEGVEEELKKIVGSTASIEWTKLLKKLSSETGEEIDALENDAKVYTKVKEYFKESKEGKIYTYTPKSKATTPNQSSVGKDGNCLTCGELLKCPEIANYKCKGYVKAKSSEVLSKYEKGLEKVKELVSSLIALTNELALIETEKKVAEVSKPYCPKELTPAQFRQLLKDTKMTEEEFITMPTEMRKKILEKTISEAKTSTIAISKRNKDIIKLAREGLLVDDIAGELGLKPELVKKEIAYLVKLGMIDEPKTNNQKAEKALKNKDGRTIVVPA
jgi:DNA-binding NarL/FixJ family response regulator